MGKRTFVIISVGIGIVFTVAGVAQAGPLVITQGGTYRGAWSSDDPDVPVVTIKTTEPVVIERSNLSGRGALIVAESGRADLTVRDTRGTALNPNLPDRAAGRFVRAEEVSHLTVEHCELNGTAGIYVYRLAAIAVGDTASIRIIANVVNNIDGRRSDGHGGYRDFNRRTRSADDRVEEGFDVVQFVQLNDVSGLENGEIGWNTVENKPGLSRVEDNISIYESSGTTDHPLLIHDNCIVGAYTIDPAHVDGMRDGWNEDWQYSGGGIMCGDGPGKSLAKASGNVRACGNVVVRTSNYGIAVSSGHDVDIRDNRVVASGNLPDGTRIATQNVGIYLWDVGHGARRTPPTFFSVHGSGNVVAWSAAGGPPARNDWWVPNATDWVGNLHLAGPITPADEFREVEAWRARAAAEKQSPGIRASSQ